MQLAGNRPLDRCLAHFRTPRPAAHDAAATKPAHLLLLTRAPRPYPVFHENRRPCTCGFIFARDGMVGGCRLNVVDGPGSWREVPGGGRAGAGKEGGGVAARGARPAGQAGLRGSPRTRRRTRHGRPPRPPKVFPKLSLHRRGSSRIVLFRTGA